MAARLVSNTITRPFVCLNVEWHLAKPLNIITGRGTHSANRVGVLKPAVKSALVEDGWHVGAWDGGLVVKGKQGIYAR